MDFSREQLQDKNLFELREIARENRVQSPTKLNKEELISQIVEASSQRVKGLKIRPVSRPSKLVDAPRRNAQNDVPDKAAESINEIILSMKPAKKGKVSWKFTPTAMALSASETANTAKRTSMFPQSKSGRRDFVRGI